MSKKSKKTIQVLLKEKGQLSIFLGITVSVIITLLAFVINVGLFVKAKINLQNAVDAGAWSGAAVQSRQLSNIAYMNWELRNTMKEWMFKYYVLGQMGMTKLGISSPEVNGSATLDFKLKTFDPSDPGNSGSGDPFNLPTICIHFGSPNNICEIFNIPGIPRFPTVGLPGISERHETFLNSIRDIKSSDCAERSAINQGTAMLWAYGTGSNLFADAPEVAAGRIGAWPEALEIAFRIRNLEAIVNRAPVPGAICRIGSNCTSVTDLQNQFSLPLNERPIKAMMGAFRNLSGGAFKATNSDAFSGTFKITELKPNIGSEVDQNSLSGLLIPSNRTIADEPALRKYYLDLQVYPINYVTYYTAYFQNNDTIAGVVAEGACYGTKTALPVPGYITGFAKNNTVMTYYAIKGEADFIGMFFPFTETATGIKLQAYAAAKPFGGRIGPKLFGVSSSGRTVIPRVDDNLSRSAAFITGVDPPATFSPGAMLPAEQSFWASTTASQIGGDPTEGGLVFGLPNFTYDFPEGAFTSLDSQIGSTPVGIVASGTTPAPLGLYDPVQYKLFKANLTPVNPGDVLTSQMIDQSIEGARRATRWDALNYLVPTVSRTGNGDELIDTIPVANILSSKGVSKYHLFAPLITQELLFQNEDDIITQVNRFLDNNDQSIEAYLDALKGAAEVIKTLGQGVVGGGGYQEAYESIYPLASDPLVTTFNGSPACKSMAHKFKFFFTLDNSTQGCDQEITPIKQMMREYFSIGGIGAANQVYGDQFSFNLYYESSFAVDPAPGATGQATAFNKLLHSGYQPGPRTGASETGQTIHPIKGTVLGLSKRNFYSTKLISMSKVTQGGTATFSDQPIYQEKDQLGYNPIPNEIRPGDNNFINTLNSSDLSEFGDASTLAF
ncbi:MAG: Tad domain-containing protein [Bacteriovoracaceae bacterium]|jgi:hypothetical protein|nr:Tad domain-containing protein [Bacteriovoracaceae bacterium]